MASSLTAVETVEIVEVSEACLDGGSSMPVVIDEENDSGVGTSLVPTSALACVVKPSSRRAAFSLLVFDFLPPPPTGLSPCNGRSDERKRLGLALGGGDKSPFGRCPPLTFFLFFRFTSPYNGLGLCTFGLTFLGGVEGSEDGVGKYL